jgi:DNA-binding NarL/FixJ family response regulator
MTVKLLIVDDSEPIRASLRGLLRCIAGISRIEEATTLAEAVQSVLRDASDLMILDLHLPDGLATQVIGRLKQLAPNMGIAVLTLHAEQGYRQKCLALGADWFFDKTRECEDLLAVVRQYAELH